MSKLNKIFPDQPIASLSGDPQKRTTPIKVAMMRLKTGEMLISATSRVKIKTALPLYRNRRGIETLCSCLKNMRFRVGRYAHDQPA